MFRRRGVMLTNLLRSGLFLFFCLPLSGQAISVGSLTFSMSADDSFVAKRVLNNNQTARLYQIAVVGIDRPGQNETRTRPADGELLFAPRQITLQAAEGEYFKFYYHGPQDGKERYYRVSFREIPTHNRVVRTTSGAAVSIDPVVVMDTILVVRPRHVEFKWDFDRNAGIVRNTGNTRFKLIIKPGCETREEDGDAWYLRPGDTVHQAILRQPGNNYIVYNNKFIKISDGCQ